MRRSIAFFCLCLLFSTLPLCAPAQENGERILYMHSDIRVQPDSLLQVTETFRVQVENIEIKHGIYRDFPTHYQDKLGNHVNIGFKVLDVQRDGATEPYHLAQIGNGVRIYIGDRNTYVSPGIHSYVLRYQANREIGFFKDYDELYWNVTGSGWVFPIDHAGAIVTLPAGVPAGKIHVEGYTGPQGATGQNYQASVNQNGQAVFDTTTGLGPKEGLTIVVTFPKGYVTPLSAKEQTHLLLQDNAPLLIGIVGLAALLFYFITSWSLVGKDPAKGTIIPLFGPPPGLSPASLRYIWHMGYDDKALSAALINIAVKGYITILQTQNVLSSLLGSTFTIKRTGKALAGGTAPDALSSEEDRLLAILLPYGSDMIALTNTNYRTFQQAISDVKTDLKNHDENVYFVTNTAYFIPGLLLSLLVLAISFYRYVSTLVATGGDPAELVGLVFTGIPVLIFCTSSISLIKQIIHGSVLQRVVSVVGLVFIFIFCSVFVVVGTFIPIHPPYALIGLAGVVIGIDTLFYHLMKAPTASGRKVLDAIEGFRLYLTVAEEGRLNAMNPPERTPELFEQFLPYALALDAEQAWAQHFTDVLQRAAVDHHPYQPVWYMGNAWNSAQPAGFATALGSSFASAISSSSTAPGSSSGSGGGGSSGGGGGGGGGGGW